jgi:hypothetical protein
MSNNWKPVSYGDPPGCITASSGARLFVEDNPDYPGVERVTVTKDSATTTLRNWFRPVNAALQYRTLAGAIRRARELEAHK